MKYKTNSLLTESKQIKEFFEKNKKIPLSCTLTTGEIISPYLTAYLLSIAINDKFKQDSYESINVRAYDPNKNYPDTINEDVLKDDYLMMISNFIKFTKKYHRVPRFITTQKSQTKVSFELFMYCLSKIVTFHQANGYLPNYCNFNKGFVPVKQTSTKTSKKEVKKSTSNNKKTTTCTNPYTSTPHLMDENMGQDTGYGCANNAEQQEFYKLTGKIFKESELAKLSGTTRAGTDHQGINTCIAAIAKKLGIKLTVKWVNFSDLGNTIEERFEALAKIICQPNKGVITHIAYMNGGEDEFNPNKVWFGHYEPIRKIDIKSKTVEVLNSLGYKRADGGYKGHLQKRSYKVEASYLKNTPGGQPSICIITKS